MKAHYRRAQALRAAGMLQVGAHGRRCMRSHLTDGAAPQLRKAGSAVSPVLVSPKRALNG